jgi:hypothetical protein
MLTDRYIAAGAQGARPTQHENKDLRAPTENAYRVDWGLYSSISQSVSVYVGREYGVCSL